MKLNISVFEGGEDLFVYPFSVHPNITNQQNKIVYLNPDEFLPNKNDYILDARYSYICQFLKMDKILSLKRIWYCHIKKFLVALKRSFRFMAEFNFDKEAWKGFWSTTGWLYTCSVPFLAASYPDIRISIRGQLMVKDDDRMTNTYYLNPSQRYLNKRVMDWIEKSLEEEDIDENGYENAYKKDAKALKKWMEEERNKGREIHYLVSLDT